MSGLETQLAEFFVSLITILSDLTTIAWAAPLIVIVVALIKNLPWLKRVQASYLHLAVQVVFWVLYVIFIKIGVGDSQLQSWTEGLTVVLQTLLPLVTSLFGAEWLYSKAKQNAVPLLGARRAASEEPGLSMASLA